MARLRMTTVSAFSMWPVGTARYAGNGEMARARITHFSNPPFNTSFRGFPGGSEVKASARNAGDLGSIPGREDPLEKEMATHSSILAWRIPWTEELVGYSPWGQKRVGHD